MSKYLTLLTVMAGMLALMVQENEPGQSNEESAAIYMKAFIHRDFDTLASFYTAETVYVDPTSRTTQTPLKMKGRSEILSRLKEVYPAETQVRFEVRTQFTSGDYHLSAGRVYYQPPAEVLKDSGIEGGSAWLSTEFVVVLEFDGGSVLRHTDYADYESLSRSFVELSSKKDSNEKDSNEKEQKMPKILLNRLIGKWKGNCRTWFKPGELADESEVSGEFTSLFQDRSVRHVYEGAMSGNPRHGEELIAFNSISSRMEHSWVDDFHMSSGILFSRGELTDQGFNVLGEYETGPGQPKWGWRTEYEFADDKQLTITSYNIMPDGTEGKAVEVTYQRVEE